MQHVKIMKGIKATFFTICLVIFNVASVIAQDEPIEMPEPGGGGTPGAPPNDPLPIDDHVVSLLILGIVLGGIMIYKNKIKKASM